MKRAIKIIIGCLCFASVILAGAENPDGSCNLAWTLSWLAIAVNCATLLRWLKADEKEDAR